MMTGKTPHRWRERPDTEHEQAIIRLLLSTVVAAYVLFMLRATGQPVTPLLASLLLAFFTTASIIVIWLVAKPGISISRRILGSIIDNGGITGILLLNGDLAAPTFIVYLWVAFGNGFRYGRRYLLFSSALAILGFSSVIYGSGLWHVNRNINIGLLVGLIALPLYVASLLGRLEKALIKAEAGNRAQSIFLATMSHEIRTPLNGLIGLLDLLDETGMQPRQRHYVELMKNSSAWLLNVISDGLDFTKIEAGELVIDPAPVDLREVIRDIAEMHREMAGAKGVTFTCDISKLTTPQVQCDRNRLAQILNNLLTNACKFTPRGHISLHVASTEQNGGSVRLFFQVRDTGIGIARDQQQEIFSPFKQLSSEDIEMHRGSGLGLAISSRLVSMMGGEIKVQSEPGAGSTFSFHLDVPATKVPPTAKAAATCEHILWMRPPHILLVEDNDINREVATAYLARLGCRTTSAHNGLEALDAVRTHTFDLILMDCQMPKMDGYEATRQIRGCEEQKKRNTIVALTAHITTQDRQKCMEAGMDDYMGKPYSAEALQALLCRWLAPLLAAGNETLSQPKKASRPQPAPAEEKSYDRAAVHDLRNALTGVIGGVELASLTTGDPPACKRHLTTALDAARRAVDLSRKL